MYVISTLAINAIDDEHEEDDGMAGCGSINCDLHDECQQDLSCEASSSSSFCKILVMIDDDSFILNHRYLIPRQIVL